VAARFLKVTLRQLVARRASEIEGAFASIGSDRPDVLFLPISSLGFPMSSHLKIDCRQCLPSGR
jgi:hypothetical protein